MGIIKVTIKMIFKTKIFFEVLIITYLITCPSFAEKISLDRISNYINELTMLKADFEQINTDGSIDTGILYIRRPGKMRLEYAAPNNTLVIAGAGSVAIFDNKTKNGPILFPLKRTPLNFLLKDNVKLNDKIITEHKEDNNKTFIVVQDIQKVSNGKIKMVFRNNPISLLGWVLTNQSEQETSVILKNKNKNIKIPLYLFNITAASKIKN